VTGRRRAAGCGTSLAEDELATRARLAIREFLEREFPAARVQESDAPMSLEIEAAHPAVGPMHIQIDPDEITVFVGPTHCHFDLDDDAPEARSVQPAITFVREVLADRIVLWSSFGAAGAYARDESVGFRVPWPVKRLLWSGPIER
jgi:hypothetical protein